MPDMRYFQALEKFLGYSWEIFTDYYQDNTTFTSQFNSIATDEEKNKFLMLASFYKFLVRDGRFLLGQEGDFVDYLDETYKFIAIMAFIEALYEDQKFIDFYQWLARRKERENIFPITNLEQLTGQYEEYKQIYGASRKVRNFFASLDPESQQLLATRIRVNGNIQPIDALAKLLYDIRSEFMNSSRLILEFNNIGMISRRGNSEIVSYISLTDLSILFEHGLLQHFGFKPEKQKY